MTIVCGWCYLDEGVPAVHGLADGQSFGHALPGSHEGALGQTLLQLCGVHLREAGADKRSQDQVKSDSSLCI